MRSYTLQEEIANTATHSIGALICAFLFGMLVFKNYFIEPTHIANNIGCIIFGLSSMFVCVASSLYHAISNISIKKILKAVDHIAIFFLIAGTYIPLTLSVIITMHPIIGYSFLTLQCISVVAGIYFKLFSKHCYNMVSVLIYCILGWSVILILGPLINCIGTNELYWLIAGGIAYTFGVPFYVLKQYKWTHSIWHVFVLIGIICHSIMMFGL